jgi:hypothetical protein
MLISFLHKMFHIMSLFFIWSEFYHIKYKDRLYVRFNERKIDKTTFTDYIFYITKIFYFIWILVGLFSAHSMAFLSILLISAIKFLILLFRSKKFIDIYDTISSILCVSILIYIFISSFF